MMQPILTKIIRSFHKAIGAEMDAMRRQLGPFEVPVSNGRVLGPDAGETAHAYRFDMAAPNDKLVVNLECTLTCEGGEHLVTISALDKGGVTVTSAQSIQLRPGPYTLVIYPWFLYEKLKRALESLFEREEGSLALALTLFGKLPPRTRPVPHGDGHQELNDSQRRAIQLCCDNNLAFVWGPPGTGKTTTLGHIVTELLSHGHRVLITSTTNAAVDQALAKLAELDAAKRVIAAGGVVRVGQCQGETHGASLDEVVARLNAAARDRLEALTTRRAQVRRQTRQCETLLAKLEAEAAPAQADLFDVAPHDAVSIWELTGVFSDGRARAILTAPASRQVEIVARRKERLEAVDMLCGERIARQARELRNREGAAVREARVVLATMTNMYVSALLHGQRFDAVIVEEAGMAILPTLFYCASLAESKVIMVGDPKQLPPIVQSTNAYVYQAMGRSIFEVTAPEPHASDAVVMLDTQYRMHPVIGDLVSGLFYDGQLKNGENTRDRTDIADRHPYPGAPLVVVDMAHRSVCARRDGSHSRFNEATARCCTALAFEAVRDGSSSVAVITPYVEQSRLIRRLLSEAGVRGGQVECSTVHRFQGNERDVVILDTVDAPPLPPGVLLSGASPRSAARNVINVSISRARGKLVIVADVPYFEDRAPRGAITELLRRACASGLRASRSEGEEDR
jgi:AAA domain